MYLVFLDFDGVLAHKRVHLAGGAGYSDHYNKWSKFDPVAIDFFNRIHDTYLDVRFVIMSSWKSTADIHDEYTEHVFQSMLRNAGFRGALGDPWKTNPYNEAGLDRDDRAIQVKDYLVNKAPYAQDFILFDDNRFRFKEVLGKGRLVQTSENDGLLSKHMLDALSIMGHWEHR
ncbi:HAD domain-containing protein [Salipiger mucosus]|uniref:FCP1 homology domain-containing protein n=1 Tax=Salipiger mucosus DSM 16094 TaxID=1123237 RepID=S9Q5V4_9RHOB|nr:HAD domain-containing protein [Salipiger mucosus]EPX76761.1 hypothetical protein Salmuc_04647 [Salipiger mucosus DSM 16094]